MKLFKVLRMNGANEFVSAWVNSKCVTEIMVTYPLDGTIVKPRLAGSKLFVFDSLENARNWARNVSTFRMYIAEVEAVGEVCEAHAISDVLLDKDIIRFWVIPPASREGIRPPKGTRFVDALKIVNRNLTPA